MKAGTTVESSQGRRADDLARDVLNPLGREVIEETGRYSVNSRLYLLIAALAGGEKEEKSLPEQESRPCDGRPASVPPDGLLRLQLKISRTGSENQSLSRTRP
jgi:hypothetical protein